METRQVDFEALIRRVFGQWKKLLILGMVLAILWCGYKYISFSRSDSSTVPVDNDNAEAVEQYEYYTRELAEINEKIVETQQYLDHSLLKDFDPFNAYQGVCVFGLTGDDSEHSVIISQVWAYLKNGLDYTGLAEKYQTEPQYIQELVSVSFIENEKNDISVKVSSPEKEMAEDILNFIRTEGKAEADRIIAQSGNVTVLTVSDAQISKGTDSGIMDVYVSKLTTISNLIDRRTKFEDQKSIAGSYKAAASDQTFGVKKAIRYLGTGFLGGIILGFIALSLALLRKNCILSADEFAKQLKTDNLNTLNHHLGNAIISRSGLKTADTSELNENVRLLTDKLKMNNRKGSYLVVSEPEEPAMSRLNGFSKENAEVQLTFANMKEAQDYLLNSEKKFDGMIILGEIGKTKYSTVESFLKEFSSDTPLIGVLTI